MLDEIFRGTCKSNCSVHGQQLYVESSIDNYQGNYTVSLHDKYTHQRGFNNIIIIHKYSPEISLTTDGNL